jgi:predicted small secreted protein
VAGLAKPSDGVACAIIGAFRKTRLPCRKSAMTSFGKTCRWQRSGRRVAAFKETILKTLMLILTAATFTLSGCNTVQGIGKDIEKGGEAIQKAVK